MATTQTTTIQQATQVTTIQDAANAATRTAQQRNAPPATAAAAQVATFQASAASQQIQAYRASKAADPRRAVQAPRPDNIRPPDDVPMTDAQIRHHFQQATDAQRRDAMMEQVKREFAQKLKEAEERHAKELQQLKGKEPQTKEEAKAAAAKHAEEMRRMLEKATTFVPKDAAEKWEEVESTLEGALEALEAVKQITKGGRKSLGQLYYDETDPVHTEAAGTFTKDATKLASGRTGSKASSWYDAGNKHFQTGLDYIIRAFEDYKAAVIANNKEYREEGGREEAVAEKKKNAAEDAAYKKLPAPVDSSGEESGEESEEDSEEDGNSSEEESEEECTTTSKFSVPCHLVKRALVDSLDRDTIAIINQYYIKGETWAEYRLGTLKQKEHWGLQLRSLMADVEAVATRPMVVSYTDPRGTTYEISFIHPACFRLDCFNARAEASMPYGDDCSHRTMEEYMFRQLHQACETVNAYTEDVIKEVMRELKENRPDTAEAAQTIANTEANEWAVLRQAGLERASAYLHAHMLLNRGFCRFDGCDSVDDVDDYLIDSQRAPDSPRTMWPWHPRVNGSDPFIVSIFSA